MSAIRRRQAVPVAVCAVLAAFAAAGPAQASVDYLGSGACFCQGVASDSTGAIYTGDPGINQVVKLDPAGNVVSRFGGPGQFSFPATFAVDDLDNLYVGDNGKTSMFTSGGVFVRSFGSSAAALAVD